MQDEKIDVAPGQRPAKGEAKRSGWMQLPFFEAASLVPCALPPAFQAFAENGLKQGKEAWDTLGAAAEKTYSESVRRLDEYGVKILEAGRYNVDTAFDCCRELAAAKTQSELVEVWSTHAQRQLEAMLTQNREIWLLTWKAATDAQPIMTGITQTFARSR
jgi:hypothetical protein